MDTILPKINKIDIPVARLTKQKREYHHHQWEGISLETTQYIKKDSKKRVKNPPAMQETQKMWIRSLGQEYTPGGGNGNHSRILTWKIPWTEEPGGLQSMGSQKNWTWLSN